MDNKAVWSYWQNTELMKSELKGFITIDAPDDEKLGWTWFIPVANGGTVSVGSVINSDVYKEMKKTMSLDQIYAYCLKKGKFPTSQNSGNIRPFD
jgi:hypothetical protein